jgi:LCP family protein required for cell wall assembly
MKIKILVTILIVFIAGALGAFYFFMQPAFSETSNTSLTFKPKATLKNDGGITNVLIVGVDTRDSKYLNTGTLTDTMILASVNKNTKTVKLLSVPRDLWVSYDSRSSKINEVFTVAGIETLKDVLEDSLGVNIHYFGKVDFNSSKQFIDELDGIEVNNPVAFTDYNYPKFGWENETCGIDIEELEKQKAENEETVDEYDFPCRFETVSFNEGVILLDGENALKYARSRHSIDNNQGTDFARAKRQHLVIAGVRDKLLTTGVLTDLDRLKTMYTILSESVETDFKVNDVLLGFTFFGNISDYTIESAVISDSGEVDTGGVLVRGNPDLYNGLYVLVPSSEGSLTSFVNTYFYSQDQESDE